MAQIPNLDNAPLSLTSLRFGGISEHGVELRHLSSEPVQTECTKVVYLIRSQLNLVKLISAHIQNDLSKGIQREYSVYFVPRRTVACEKIFEEEKVHHLLTIGEYPLHMIPLDEDVLSFELDLAYSDYLVDGDASALWHIAKSIHKLECSFGVIPNVRAKGKASAWISEILTRVQAEEPVSTSDVGIPQINTLILLDRETWLHLCVQLTYEGLMDEQEGKKTKVPLNSSDKLFKETRDLNFGVVLNQKAKDMRQDYMELHTANRSFSEINDYVKKLSSLTGHIGLTQHLAMFTSKPSFSGKLDMDHAIVEIEASDVNFENLCFEYIEEMIHKQEPIVNVLRLLVLFSITNSGLPKKKFDYISPNDIACFFPGYAPLTLLAYGLCSMLRPIEEILKLLPGPHSEIKRGGYSSTPLFATLPGAPASIDKVADGRRSLVLVVFVGGVTFAEISALRHLNAQEGMAYDLIVGTTKMVNGNTIIETFMETIDTACNAHGKAPTPTILWSGRQSDFVRVPQSQSS
ncbi:hypothetical protein C5167_005840 [Papaver somniferum]|uniref:Uncharacterized protein n=1 Tax=Papaver somniferum TaxID=3469 RepID=A0A4Y7JFW7_PAPSO|nr:hypothetical protein C5167_005840 [Papaver somniferum]